MGYCVLSYCNTSTSSKFLGVPGAEWYQAACGRTWLFVAEQTISQYNSDRGSSWPETNMRSWGSSVVSENSAQKQASH